VRAEWWAWPGERGCEWYGFRVPKGDAHKFRELKKFTN